MEIRPIGSRDISFPYKKRSNNINKTEPEMIYEPKGDTPFPPKLKAVIIIPKGEIEVSEDDGTNN